ncbi:hypothetical protein N3K66_005419 [Trichothecium roseum]|uniref:Uncharacterized protein n=1 Tax=Trichothecium roseum TaxID=47278 RepID=A0ACC0UXT8_9HYPO|nr:hypothetical protein N3K66_005419 [Trichothecium roseum]
MKIVLAINAGSSSVKISVYQAEGRGSAPVRLAEAQVSGLTAPPARLTYDRGGVPVHRGKDVSAGGTAISTQGDAFALLLDTIVGDEGLAQVRSRDDVALACHRVVHGGDYASSQLITASTLHHLSALSDLAPLHNGPALGIVRSCLGPEADGGGGGLLPRAANVACFDTQFHASIPPHVRTYPIDQAVACSNGLRKYGFHGLSYAFITRATAAHLGKPGSETSLVALHLGSGASACAVRAGRSADTSMGLTPLAGLPGATRSGSVDPSLVFHYASDVGRLSPSSTADLHISRAEEILNKRAGWSALAGTTDFAAIASAAAEDPASNPEAALAFDLFVDRVSAFVGSYYVSLRGRVDALVFAGGIGEKSPRLRAAVVGQVSCLGFTIDPSKNDADAPDAPGSTVWDIGAPGSAHRVLVCRTDEQYEMARDGVSRDDVWSSSPSSLPTSSSSST